MKNQKTNIMNSLNSHSEIPSLRLCSINQVRKAFGVRTAKVKKLIADKKLLTKKIDGTLYIPFQSAMEYINSIDADDNFTAPIISNGPKRTTRINSDTSLYQTMKSRIKK